jgi:hypothetical protein
MNAINVIAPYKHLGMWVFDDPRVGLAGADTMIDRVVCDIPDAANGFVMVFSAMPFPGHQYRLERRRGDDAGGNWYYAEALETEGWLCPALLKYFDDAPKQLYVQVEAPETGALGWEIAATGCQLVAKAGLTRRLKNDLHGNILILFMLFLRPK